MLPPHLPYYARVMGLVRHRNRVMYLGGTPKLLGKESKNIMDCSGQVGGGCPVVLPGGSFLWGGTKEWDGAGGGGGKAGANYLSRNNTLQ